MHENFGVFRREEQMRAEGEIVARLRERYERVVVEDKGDVFNNDLTQALELGFLLDLAEAVVERGAARNESRGGHYREDYPNRDDANFMRHSMFYKQGEGLTAALRLAYKPVPFTRYKPMER